MVKQTIFICVEYVRVYENPMSTDTKKLHEDTRQRLFEFDEFRVSRELVQWVQPNSGEPDDLEVLLDRVDSFA